MTKQYTWARFSLLLPLALSACISVGGGTKESAANIYTLPSGSAGNARTPAPARGAAVVVAKPELPAGFDTERIALYFEKEHRLDYYADAKWSARLDDLLQDFVIQRAKQKLPGLAVGTADIAPSARYRLAVKVTEFMPVYADTPDKPPRLNVAIMVTVTALPGGAVKTQVSMKKSAMASANTLTIVTKELGDLLQAATDEALQKAAPSLSGGAS